MEVGMIALILFGSLIITLMLGVPVAFAMSGISIIVGYFVWGGFSSVEGFVMSSFTNVQGFVFVAVPLYILMAAILRYSDLVDGMYEAFYRWLGGLRGGLAVGTTIMSAMFAAMVGVSSVATATLGVTARPSMISRGYDSKLTTGIILGASGLGLIIPPSILMIIYGMVTGVSPGKLFMAGIIPGLLIAGVFIIYCLIYCHLYPDKGPALSKEERFTWKEKFFSLKGVILPMMVILVVILSIFLGIATATEAASVGVVGALVSAAINRKLTWSNFKKMISMTVSLCTMMFWLVIGAAAYSKIVSVTNIGNMVADIFTSLNLSPTFLVIILILLFFVLGMFIDPTAILFITAPLFLPLMLSMEIDLIWFGIIYIICGIMANLTPPFGVSLFVLKGVAPEIPMKEMYSAIIPFILLYFLVIAIIMIFPQIVLWLPSFV